MNFFKNKRIRQGCLFIGAFSLVGMISLMLVKAGVNKPSLTITYDSTIISGSPSTDQNIKGLVNQDIEIKYKVTPGDLAFNDVNTQISKEIVLVLDTSGSMNDAISSTDSTIRIEALKNAATNFVNKFTNVPNVKIGLANYSTNANYNNLSLPLTSTITDSTTLVNKISSYKRSTYDKFGNKNNNGNIEGGTNTGDGIRYALNMLNDGTSAKKFVVLMSDGEPTFYMKKAVTTQQQVWHDGYYSWNGWQLVWNSGYYTTQTVTTYQYYTDLNNNSGAPILDGPGNQDDSQQNCLNYASTMASKIKDFKYTSFDIAYSAGGSADKMNTLATASGGSFYSALDANAINNVFSGIADQIKGSYVVGGVNLNYTLPDGIQFAGTTTDVTINGSTYTQKLPDINYKLSSDQSKYTADPFYISFKVRATKIGSYSLPQNTTLNYTGLDGSTISIPLTQTISYVANDLVTDGTPIINASIDSQNPDPTTIGQDVALRYKINPQGFQVFDTTNGTKVPSYTFKAKLKFNLQGKFTNVSGLNSSADPSYNVETPEFNVVYDLDANGNYVPEPIDYKYFTIRVNDGVDINNLQFGPGIVSYIDLNNKSASTSVAPYSLNMRPAMELKSFGLYNGMVNNQPSISENSSAFNIAKKANIRLGATLTGSINNNSKLNLDIESGILLNSTIDVYSYDDNGTLTLIGNMQKIPSTDTTKSTYTYNGQDVVNKKILILYNESLDNNVVPNEEYANKLYIGNDEKVVELKPNNGVVELF